MKYFCLKPVGTSSEYKTMTLDKGTEYFIGATSFLTYYWQYCSFKCGVDEFRKQINSCNNQTLQKVKKQCE